jgi:hypothetical protein
LAMIDEDGVEWRPVVGFEDFYAVSSAGRVKRTAPGRRTRPGFVLRVRLMYKRGYPTVKLCTGNGTYHVALVHRLVATAFIGPPPEGGEVNHKDGVQSNNDWRNLEWTTRLGNAQHAAKTGLYKKGADVKGSKLTVDEVRAILALRTCGWTYEMLAKGFGVSGGTIGCILSRKWWKDVWKGESTVRRRGRCPATQNDSPPTEIGG